MEASARGEGNEMHNLQNVLLHVTLANAVRNDYIVKFV
jgi:hypothetical protein